MKTEKCIANIIAEDDSVYVDDFAILHIISPYNFSVQTTKKIKKKIKTLEVTYADGRISYVTFLTGNCYKQKKKNHTTVFSCTTTNR
ncbi:hypothetical protein SAMN05216391_11954 [Lachnospiraceae bacterium KHCPX20]|nr:hypothetical protein SAMN05216391_11954 [Lachnospiraceae bacterium KHCPX20]